MHLLHSTWIYWTVLWLYWLLNDSIVLCHGPTYMYHGCPLAHPWLHFRIGLQVLDSSALLLHGAMALTDSKSHYCTVPWFYLSLYLPLVGSSWLHWNVATLYLTLLDCTSLYNLALQLNLLHCTPQYHGSTWLYSLYMDLLNSTALYHDSSWLYTLTIYSIVPQIYFTLQDSTMALL